MIRLSPLAILIGVLSAVALAPAHAAEDARSLTELTRFATIVLTEIGSAQPGEGCSGPLLSSFGHVCKTKVHVRLVRIFKDSDHLGLAPSQFEAEILQHTGGYFETYRWTGQQLKIGQQYLITSDKNTLPDLFESPAGVVLVTQKEDTLGDVDLILRSASLPLREQASAVTMALTDPVKPHGSFLSNYVAAVLQAGSDAETVALAEAIESSTESAFSDMGKSSLLYQLWVQSSESAKPRDNLFRTFVTMTARYLLVEPEQRNVDLPDLRVAILHNYLPFILGSERARSALRTALLPTVRSQVRKRALELVEDNRLPADQRAGLRELLAVLGTQ